MRGPKPSYPIELTKAEEEQLRQLVRAHTTGQTLAIRVRIVLAVHDHPGVEQSADCSGSRYQ